MYVPISPEAKLFSRLKNNYPPTHPNNWLDSTQPGQSLSFESQRQLKSLRDYVNNCRSTLSDIRMDLDHLELDPDNPSVLFGAAKRLCRFCLETDRWGFASLYSVATALQKVFLESGCRKWNNRLSEAVYKGLNALSALVERCEEDYLLKLAIDDTLECLRQTGQLPSVRTD